MRHGRKFHFLKLFGINYLYPKPVLKGMKKKIFLGLSLIAGIVALWIILKVIPINEIILSFSQASRFVVISYILVSTGLMASLAWRWKVILKTQKIDIPFLTVFAYRIIGYGISYLTPAAKLGGEPFRAGMLTRHNVDFPKALSSVVIDKTIEVSANGLFFFVGAIIALFNFTLPTEAQIILLSVAIGFLVIALLFYQRMASGQGFIKQLCLKLKLHRFKSFKQHKLEKFENRLIKFYKEDTKEFVLSVLLSLLSWMFMFLEFKFALLILGHDVSFKAIFLIVTFVGAAVLIPVPMALGALEASQLAVFRLLNLKTAGAVALAFLVRARDLAWTFLGMALLSYYGFKVSKTIKKTYT